jgi:hypothetical protein
MPVLRTTDRAKHTKRVHSARMGLRLAAAVVAVGIPCFAQILTTAVLAANTTPFNKPMRRRDARLVYSARFS